MRGTSAKGRREEEFQLEHIFQQFIQYVEQSKSVSTSPQISETEPSEAGAPTSAPGGATGDDQENQQSSDEPRTEAQGNDAGPEVIESGPQVCAPVVTVPP